jgi:hypothetical protein
MSFYMLLISNSHILCFQNKGSFGDVGAYEMPRTRIQVFVANIHASCRVSRARTFPVSMPGKDRVKSFSGSETRNGALVTLAKYCDFRKS